MSAADLAKLTRLASIAKPNTALKLILQEAVGASGKVGRWESVTTSGSAVARYDPKTAAVTSYDVRYQYGDLGNLVHELTHVAVNEAYGQDFVNYRNRNGKPPEPDLDTEGRRKNEQARQAKWMSDENNKQMPNELAVSWARPAPGSRAPAANTFHAAVEKAALAAYQRRQGA
jgi:hypothetical protein